MKYTQRWLIKLWYQWGGIGSNPSQSKKITVTKKDITQLDRDDVLYCMTENPIYLRHY